MSEVWMTHPGLTPAHDFKAAGAAVGTWMGSGWQVRVDQADPVAVDEPADPRPPAPPEPVDEPADESEPVKPVPSPRSPKES